MKALFYLPALFLASLVPQALHAQSSLDIIGITALRQSDATLIGSGVRVGQPEAANTTDWQVNPYATGQPVSLFTYTSGTGTATTFANSVGTESGHADAVGDIFYGKTNTLSPEGVAYAVSKVDCYDASYFYSSIIHPRLAINAKVVNQSFIFSGQLVAVDQEYDTYVAQYNTIFVSGVGNGGPPSSPATCYNDIGVGAYGGSSSVGPTSDGRCKPDITAPAGATSYSTPLVSGAAAILVQAGLRGDGGSGTATDATDPRTVKALLLNGAVKPIGWTWTETAPLDPLYGAGVLNVLNSYKQLKGGKRGTGTVSSLSGWNLTSISGQPLAIHHYYFILSASLGSSFDFTATLVWNRDLNETNIKDLDLALYNSTTNTLIPGGFSHSAVNNVEHLWLKALPPGQYDLQMIKNATQQLATTETYALAFNFCPRNPPGVQIANVQSGDNNTQVSFTAAGGKSFQLEARNDILDPVQPWSVVATGTTSASGTTTVSDPGAAGQTKRFYRVAIAVP